MAINFNEGADVVNVNTGNLGADPKKVMRLSNSLRKCRNYGKAWEVGDQGTVFYPFKWWPDESLPAGGTFEMLMAAYYGHRVNDLAVLGTSFLRSLACINEHGRVVGEGDLAYQFSKIAGLVVHAQREHELAELNKKEGWDLLGPSAYQMARQAIEDKYTKDGKNAIKPLIGHLMVLKLTEVVYVAMDPNKGIPIFEDTRKQRTGTYIQNLSDNRLDKLRTLANDCNMGILAQNPGLVPDPDQVYFLEVIYNFTSAQNSKTEAGRTDPQGVAQSVTILARNPALKSKLDQWQSLVPTTPDGIAAHTYDMSPLPDDILRTRLQTYLFDHVETFKCLTPEDKDRLVKSAQLLDYLRIVPQEDPELNQRLTEALGHPIGAGATSSAPTLESIMSGENGPDFSKQQADPTKISGDIEVGDDDTLLPDGVNVDLSGMGA